MGQYGLSKFLANVCKYKKIYYILDLLSPLVDIILLYLIFSLFPMSENRITEQRKRFVEVLGQNPRIPFSDLKKELV